MIDSSANTLFSLLRLALGTSTEVPDLSSLTKSDWQKLIDLSFNQGVAAVSVDGFGLMVRICLIPRNWRI